MNNIVNNRHPYSEDIKDVIRVMTFNLGEDLKGDPIEALKKARFYLDDEIKRLSGEVDPQPADTPNEPYRPKEGEDARTRDGRKAVFVDFEPNDCNPYLCKIDGVPCLYNPSGRRFLAGADRSCDLIAPWEGE